MASSAVTIPSLTILPLPPRLFIAERRDAPRIEHGQDIVLKAAELAVHDVKRHLHGRPGIGLGQHLEMDRRILVARESQEADFALFLGLQRIFDGTPLVEDPVGIVVVDDLMKLPEVEMIGTQPPQAVFQVLLGVLGGAAAALGHEEDLVAAIALRERLAHAFFADAVVIIPGVVKKRDSLIDGPLDEPNTLAFILVRHCCDSRPDRSS